MRNSENIVIVFYVEEGSFELYFYTKSSGTKVTFGFSDGERWTPYWSI